MEHFQATVNKDLADVLGNFVNRIMRFGASRFGNAVPEGGAWGPAEQALEKTLEERIQMYQEQMLGMQFRRSAATLRSIWSAGNEYVDAAAPWTVFKADRDRAAAIVRVAINLIRLFAALSAPMIPAVAGRMLQALQLPAEPRWLSGKLAADLQAMKPGHSFQVPEVLFGKIEDAQVEDWKSQFGGAQ
jgi:methionyl-tRNA synthetase